MHATSRRGGPGSSKPLAAEEGFALIEVMVSAVLLITLALATLSLIDRSSLTSSQQRSKGVASAIASADLNRMRQTKFTDSSNFTTTATTRGVDGINYTVTSKGEWTSAAGILNTCTKPATGNPGQYVRLTSTVTWPGMGSVAPVTAETLLVPRAGEVAIAAGAFSLKVLTAAGTPVSGVSVVMNGVTLVTSAAGCVIFTGVPPGTYTVNYSKSGYIATNGLGTGAYTATVTKGTTATKTVGYDLPAKITPIAQYRESSSGTPAGATGPMSNSTGWPTYSVSAGQGVDFLGNYTWNTTTAGSSTLLYPFIGGYQVYAGNCPGNNPTVYDNGFATTFPLSSVAPDPGTSGAATAYLRQATLLVKGVPGNQALNVAALPSSSSTDMAGCAEKKVVSVTNTSSAQADLTVSMDLPYGVYSFCVDNNANTRRYTWTGSTNAYNNTPASGTPAPTTGTRTLLWSAVSSGSSGYCSGATG